MHLGDRLPAAPDPDAVLDTFVGWAAERGLTLYPAQEEALIEVLSGSNVIVNTPTGSGKSLVAAGAQLAALADGRRSFYTAPIKALVSERFFDLCATFGRERVGMMTGDAAVNPQAPIVCCTAEVLANIALRHGDQADVGQVVMDEFHFYAEPDRGWAWQVPLLTLPQAQMVLMSATLGDVSRFEADLTRRTGRPTATVRSATRPVPLDFDFRLTPVLETIEDLIADGRAPIYVVHFTQAQAVERAQSMTSTNLCTREEKDAIAELIGDFRFAPGFGRALSRYVRAGVGVHHAGMLPKYRRLVERLAQAGLLKVICGTDTLGVGINVPIRTVLFTALSKYDGTKVRHLTAREFHQIAGRAGRAGFDAEGSVVVQAPEHVVENERALAKAGDDAKKRRKVVRKKPPDGFVSWGEPTFRRLVEAEPEPLTSSFAVSHSMLVNVLDRPGDGCAAMRRLLLDNHEPRSAQRNHIRRAISIYRSLLTAGVVERLDEPDAEGRTVRVTVDLQEDFALNQPLAPFALAALDLLDPASPDHALDVVSVVESILDDPGVVLAAQVNKAKGDLVAEMKAAGVEYEERMARLEDVTHPRPLAEVLEPAFAMYRRSQPWVADHELTPKSIVRDMWERAMTFGDYVAHYGLARSEGTLLRYLSSAYKALVQTVPESAKTDDLYEITDWLGEIVRQTDSSLLDEWEALAHPETLPEAPPADAAVDHAPPPVTANVRAFRVLVRNELFRRIELAAAHRWEALGELDGGDGWPADRWREALAPYFEEHDGIGVDADARSTRFFVLEETGRRWSARQILADPAGHHDWSISVEVDLDASDEAGEAVVRVLAVGAPG
ncbi:MAG: DEAD/DEAH box helicase [Acidimicrobiia bacterium]